MGHLAPAVAKGTLWYQERSAHPPTVVFSFLSNGCSNNRGFYWQLEISSRLVTVYPECLLDTVTRSSSASAFLLGIQDIPVPPKENSWH